MHKNRRKSASFGLCASTALVSLCGTCAYALAASVEPPTASPAPGQPAGATSVAAPAITPQAPVSNGRLEEIVVTASRVRTSAQRTPIALNVYSAARIQAAGVHSVQALQTIDPSVNVTSSSGAAYVAIRGVASTDVTEIGDPSVPISRDGFFVNRSYSIASSLYDVNRIEVLKGPQGTLFGRNSTGGLVNIVTNQPGKTLSGYLDVDVGNYDTANTEGAVNVPLSDVVQLRLSGIERYHTGYRDLTGLAQKGDDERTQSGRAQLAFQPFEGFKGNIVYQHDHTNDVGDVSEDLPLAMVTPLGDPHRFAASTDTSNRLRGDRIRWEFSYGNLPFGLTATYAGGYDAEVWHHVLDATGPIYPALRQFRQQEQPDTWNQEIRLATPQDWRLTAQGGFFHFSEDNTISSGVFDEQMDAPFAGGPFDHSGQYGITFNYRVRTVSNGYFAQAGFKLLPSVKVTAGIRYTTDTKVRTGGSLLDLQALVSPFAPPISFPVSGNGSIDEARPTFHAGLDWTPSATNLIYAKYDTGFKSGGFNSNGSAPSVSYGPETLKAYELGTKNQFLDHRFELNGDAFYEDYNGYQASQTSSVLSGGGVFNVGSARIYGAEAQAVALLDDIARIDLGATYLNTRFGNGIVVFDGQSTPQPHDIGGNRLPNAPDFVLTGGVEHSFALPFATITARLDGKYSSSFDYTVFNTADTRSGNYVLGNMSATYQPVRGGWTVQAYIRNFTNERVLANAQRNYVSGLNTYEFQPPLTFGARLSYHF